MKPTHHLVNPQSDVIARIMSVLSNEIEEGAREMRLRSGTVSVDVARIYLIDAIAMNMIGSIAVLGNQRDIVQHARYLGQRALYAIGTGQFQQGGG